MHGTLLPACRHGMIYPWAFVHIFWMRVSGIKREIKLLTSHEKLYTFQGKLI